MSLRDLWMVVVSTVVVTACSGAPDAELLPTGGWIEKVDGDRRPLWACFSDNGNAGVGFEQPMLDLRWADDGTVYVQGEEASVYTWSRESHDLILADIGQGIELRFAALSQDCGVSLSDLRQ